MPRALFDCVEERRNVYGGRSFKLQAAMPKAGTPDENDPEVNAFWTATPSGTIDLLIQNPAAFLTIGQRYYVDLVPVPA